MNRTINFFLNQKNGILSTPTQPLIFKPFIFLLTGISSIKFSFSIGNSLCSLFFLVYAILDGGACSSWQVIFGTPKQFCITQIGSVQFGLGQNWSGIGGMVCGRWLMKWNECLFLLSKNNDYFYDWEIWIWIMYVWWKPMHYGSLTGYLNTGGLFIPYNVLASLLLSEFSMQK